MEGIQIVDERVGLSSDIVYLKVNGYIDTTTSLDLINRLKILLEDNISQFVLDLAGVNYVSSAGWGVFVGEIKNVREKGGDIKLINMTPEVYDVFEMLEFNRILKSYDSVEEAINEFDLIRGYDLTQTPVKEWKEDSSEVDVPDIQVSRTTAENKGSLKPAQRFMTQREVDPKSLSVSEKIKHVVRTNPTLTIREIKKTLNSDSYGNSKVSIWKLFLLLRELNMENQEKRFRYYRSR